MNLQELHIINSYSSGARSRQYRPSKSVFHLLQYILPVLIVVFTVENSFSQQRKRIIIEQADYWEADEQIAPGAQRLIGDVRIRHENVLMWADSAYTYTGNNRVDAFGNVRINQGDTLNLYARKINYNGDLNHARAYQNVRLINKTTTLFTDTLDYDLATKTGYYEQGGKIVDSLNTLTSEEGRYFTETDIVHFYGNVEAFNENYTLNSDTLMYNTQTGRAFIVGPTTIKDSLNTIYSEEGWYDTETGEAELIKNPQVYSKTQHLKANYIKYNDTEGNGKALGNVRMEDLENKIIVSGNTAQYNDQLEIATVTDSALFIMYSEKDTLFLHADTLRTVPDTIPDAKLVKAYYGTRFYRKDIQGMCDSLVYFTKDSVVQLYKNPVIWSDNHQLSAEHIEMKQNTNAPDELHLSNNGFIISKLDSGRYDQIKGKKMVGYVVDNELSHIDVDGNGQTLYYARQDEDIIGLNKVICSKISIRFRDGNIYKISFLDAPEGLLKPLFSLTEEEKILSGFDWKISQRPLSKYDVFQNNTPPEVPEEKNSAPDVTSKIMEHGF